MRAGATAGKAHAAQLQLLAQLELRVSELELSAARWQQRLIVTVFMLLLISAYLSFGSIAKAGNVTGNFRFHSPDSSPG